MDGTISFDSNSLQTYNRTTGIGIITDDIDLDNLPAPVLSQFALAHADKTVIAGRTYPVKIIPITGTVKSDTPANLDALLDTFRGYFTGKNKNLDIGYNGSTRRYTATLSPNSTIKRSANKKYAKFSFEFICTLPFGVNTTNTTALNGTGRTAAVYSDAYTWLGSAPVQLPVVTITLTAVSSTGSQQLFWGNSDTGQGITITRSTWANGDVVVIDCVNKTVTVNGVAADYSGAFPEFTPGSHTMVYSDTFTSRTMTENVVYAKRYM